MMNSLITRIEINCSMGNAPKIKYLEPASVENSDFLLDVACIPAPHILHYNLEMIQLPLLGDQTERSFNGFSTCGRLCPSSE